MRTCFVVIPLIVLATACRDGMEYPEGGYPYVTDYTAEDTGFYFLPVRDSFDRKDSVLAAADAMMFYRKMEEPNLSLRPTGEDLYRLVYYNHGPTIVTLHKTKLVVKKYQSSTIPAGIADSNNLNPTEKFHFTTLERRFPFELELMKPAPRRYYDSLIRRYPELTDAGYYFQLIRKFYSNFNFTIKYNVDTFQIPAQQYSDVIDEIEKAGFWKLPVKMPCRYWDCTGSSPFFLEANTRKKYNYVSSVDCGCDESWLNFSRACQKLLDLAGVTDARLFFEPGIDSTETKLEIREVVLEPVRPVRKNTKTQP